MNVIETVVYIEHSSNGQPIWIDNQSSLFWVEQHQQQLYQFHQPSSTISTRLLGKPVLSLSPSLKHGVIVTLQDGIGVLDMNSGQIRYLLKPEPFFSHYQLTGGIADNKGNYWATGCASNDEKQPSHCYQLSPDRRVRRFCHEALAAVASPVLSKQGRRLYQSAGTSRCVYVTELDRNGNPVSTDIFCRIAKSEGLPHGLCVDDNDNVWVCHWGGGCISCYDTSGHQIDKINIHAPDIAHCTFGGENLDILFIATGSSGTDKYLSRKQSMVGSILSCRPGCRGVKADYFYG